MSFHRKSETTVSPSPEVLRQLLRYEPETGKLFWKERGPEWFKPGNTSSTSQMIGWNVRLAGREAFTAKHGAGYRTGSVMGRLLLAHRVCFAVHFGEWPRHQVDHINGDRSDNRIENLRDVTIGENRKNTCLSQKNTSGFNGIYQSPQSGKWIAQIKVDGKRKWIGSFPTRDEAIDARVEANKRFGFSPRHGTSA